MFQSLSWNCCAKELLCFRAAKSAESREHKAGEEMTSDWVDEKSDPIDVDIKRNRWGITPSNRPQQTTAQIGYTKKA